MPAARLSTGGVVRIGTFQYENSSGEGGSYDGRTTGGYIPPTTTTGSWVQRTHPDRNLWLEDETKQRASYIGTKRHLAPFLVPHRFEGTTSGKNLPRARLAYSIGLNSSYLQDIFGHIRSTPSHYNWGSTSPNVTDANSDEAPKGGIALDIWNDATGDGTTWTNFFERRVLEWLLTSPGGFILVNSNKEPGSFVTRLFASRQGIRATLKFIPFSAVEDYGLGPNGYRWIKFAECADEREPDMEGDASGLERRHVLYELLPSGVTRIRRYDDAGNQLGRDVVQTIKDMDGKGMLPLIPVKFGEHPDISNIGSGLLMGLDDIVIDLYNLLTETREAFRDAVFTFLSYRGPDMEGVRSQLAGGSRLVHVGDDQTAELTRVGAEGNEVASGLSLIELGLKSWALSAKRRVAEVNQTLNTRSGTSLKAEFQLDLIPLMVSITEELDTIETEVMFVWAQMEGKSAQEADKLNVRRETDFQMEQEASRIARIVSEFLQAIPGMPAALLEKLIMRWANSLDFLNLDEPVDTGDGSKKPLRDVIQEQAREVAEADQGARIRQNELGILGASRTGSALGGNNNGGGRQPPPAAGDA